MKVAKTIIITVLATLLTLSVSLNIFVFTIFEIHDVDSFKEVLIATELIDSFKDLEQDTDNAPETNNPTVDIPTSDTDEPTTDDSEENKPTVDIPTHEFIMCYDETHHWIGCTNGEGCCAFPKGEHTGGTATATERAICEECGQPYGELLDESTETIPTDTIIFSEEGVTISYVTFFEDMWGLNFKFCVENNSDKTVDVRFTDVYVDDFATSISGGSCSDLLPGKKAFVELTIYESEYEEITDYPSYIEYTIKLVDSENYNTIVKQDSNTIELE